MTSLIAFRALQGLGGGGLMVTTSAAIGDIVAPRDRGRLTRGTSGPCSACRR
jgi:MFS family permease